MSEYADKNCPLCKGTGFIYSNSLLQGGSYCDCTLDALRLVNMEKVWKSLSNAPEVKILKEKPPLLDYTKKNTWITASLPVFKAHLKAVAYHQSTIWDAKVRTDAELLDSWFGTAKAQGVKIFDLEVDKSTLSAIDIRDLVEPPSLCIFVMGVKHLPNKEAPNSILEAIGYRHHVGKPCWIVDQTEHHIDSPHHLFWSDILEGIIKHWEHVELSKYGLNVLHQTEINLVTETNIDELITQRALPRIEEPEELAPAKTSSNFLDKLEIESKPKKKSGWKKKGWGKKR